MNQYISINKYLPVILLYFFFNTFLLPSGLLYTTILTPFFLIWLYKFPSFKYIGYFLLIMLPFVVIHYFNGININYYIRSFILLFSVYVFSVTVYQFLKECKSIRTLYKNLLVINTLFVILALLALTLPELKAQFWYMNEITSGINIVRLKMLTYEPSYYSILFVPIALYYYLKIILLKLPNPIVTLLLLTIPLLLSFSFGIILGLMLSIFFTFLIQPSFYFYNKNLHVYILSSIVIVVLGIFALQLFPNNVFVVRLENVFFGTDTSFKGRTADSFYLAWEIASKRSIWFGCGLGQVKEIGLDIFRKFYNYPLFTINQIGIPNAVGDTFATFGIVGVFIRLSLQVFFFFKTRVHTNYYRLSLFLFIFIYQFTGSYIMNIAEYVIWIMAFNQGIFEEFSQMSIIKRNIIKQKAN